MLLFIFFLFSWVSGQILSFNLCCGIRTSLLDLSIVLLLVFLTNKKPRTRYLTIFNKRVGPFILVGIISLLLQLIRLPLGEVLVSILYLVRFVVYASLLVTLIPLKTSIKLLGLYIAGVSIGILGLLQYVLYPNLRNLVYLGWDPHEYRLFSTLLDPNFAGILLVLACFLGFHLFLIHQRRRWLIAAGLIVCFVALLLTYSRGSFVSFVLGLTIFMWLYRQKKWVGLAVLLFFIGILFLPRPGGEGVNLLRVLSIQSRLQNSSEALQLFYRSPLFGWGFNTLRFIRNQQSDIDATLLHSAGGFHNSWLTLLVTTGIFGLSTYVFIWIRLIKKTKPKNGYPSLLLVSLTAVFVHSLFDNSLFYPQVMAWVWVLASCLPVGDNR